MKVYSEQEVTVESYLPNELMELYKNRERRKNGA
jgi:hypothetical protein